MLHCWYKVLHEVGQSNSLQRRNRQSKEDVLWMIYLCIRIIPFNLDTSLWPLSELDVISDKAKIIILTKPRPQSADFLGAGGQNDCGLLLYLTTKHVFQRFLLVAGLKYTTLAKLAKLKHQIVVAKKNGKHLCKKICSKVTKTYTFVYFSHFRGLIFSVQEKAREPVALLFDPLMWS